MLSNSFYQPIILLDGDSEIHSGNLTNLHKNINGCPGHNESFLCYSPSTDPGVGVELTTWSGSAINYTCGVNTHEIPLSHITPGEKTCTKDSTTGVIVIHAYCVSKFGCSTSQLDVTLSPELNGLSVSCSVELSNSTMVNYGPEVLNVSSKSSESNDVAHVL